jgi:isoleucyl-tRNA synthetase
LQAYDDYEFHVLYHAVHNFCAVDMSAFYLDVLKDRLYTSPKESLARRSAQTAMYRILDALTRMMAPVLSFTAEEIWGFLPGDREASAHLAEFPRFEASLIDAEIEAKYDRLLAVRSDVAKVLELARAEKAIGHSLDACVELAADGDLAKLLAAESEQLASLFIVSQVSVSDSLDNGVPAENLQGLTIRVSKAMGDKCSRCWNYVTSVGDHSEHPEICHRCLAALA